MFSSCLTVLAPRSETLGELQPPRGPGWGTATDHTLSGSLQDAQTGEP